MEQDAVYQLTNMEAMKPKEAMEPNRLKEEISWKPDGAVHDDTEGIRAPAGRAQWISSPSP